MPRFKNKIFVAFIILFFGIFLTGFAQQGSFIPKFNDGSRMTLSGGDTIIVFSVDKKADPSKVEQERFYYYYNHQHIQKSKGGFTGKPLNGVFVSQTREGKLIEKGSFKKGLKNGLWQQWYANGETKSIAKWRNGRGTGKKSLFTDKGSLICQYNWQDEGWQLTRKYAQMSERKQKEAEKARKKAARKTERSHRKAVKEQRRKAKKPQKGKFFFFRKKKQSEVNAHVGDVMAGQKKPHISRKKWWNPFKKKKEKTNNKKTKDKKADTKKEKTKKWPWFFKKENKKDKKKFKKG